MPASTLTKRLFFGTLMTLGLTGLLLGEGWLDHRYLQEHGYPKGILFGILVALFIAGGCRELMLFARNINACPSGWVLIPGSVLLVMEHFLPGGMAHQDGSPTHSYLIFILFGSLLGAGLYQGLKFRHQQALLNMAVTCFGLLYLGLGGWFLVAIRLLDVPASTRLLGPSSAILVFLLCVKSSDIGAYLIGRKFGRTPWVPSISPKKTWEGFCGGVFLSIIVASLFGLLFGIMPLWLAVVFGIVLAVTGQLGDLLESMLKRDCGCKDSASLVPEFGGVLDILDSVLVAAPFAYVMLR